jgi:putative FmdB family regulatory protein
MKMPRYDFKCQKCGYEFEKEQGMNDPNPPCPKFRERLRDMDTMKEFDDTCGGETEKLITRSSFVLKGDGWASDGYGGGSK